MIDIPSLLGCVSGLFLVGLVCYCTKPRNRGARIRAEALEAWSLRQRQAKMADPTARDKAIQQSLVVQRVMAKEGKSLTLGQLVEGQDDDSFASDQEVAAETSRQHCSLVEENDEESDCAICLEPFRVGDVVAFSRAEASNCHHPFHRECILLWFTKRNDCPYCRELILTPKIGSQDIEMGVETGNAAEEQNTIFVILNSLVSRVTRTSCSLTTSTFDMRESEILVENEEENYLLKPSNNPPSPLRRVFSCDDALKLTEPHCHCKRSRSMSHTGLAQ